MGMTDYLFSSESVTEGHPDKVSDQISDAILDAIIEQDKNGRVACETMVTTGMAIIAGEITTTGYVDMPATVRETIKQIGYTDASMGFDCKTCAVLTSIDKQSPDISQGVTEGQGLFAEQGAGDQGIMFGYACNDTPELMPMTISLAHRLTEQLAAVRKQGTLPWLRPDGKSQVSVRYVDNKPVYVDSVIIATQHSPEVSYDDIVQGVRSEVIDKIVPASLMDAKTKFYINATGRFVIGGPQGDCGVTGRKIVVDSYGGWGSHGGGAFSGKDPSKVDRTASYMARYAAKNVVAAGLADRCEVQLAYVIGVSDPLSVNVHTYGTSKIDPDKIAKLIREIFPLKPRPMIEHLDMLRPIFRKTASYGHFGRELPEFTWERTDKAAELKSAAGL
ncbi:MAG: methionine adenosyltransferase [Candidatus Alcyoniella australis]|nr:methionine adenosyltransferase [Candidatus Alcyoniella australis]